MSTTTFQFLGLGNLMLAFDNAFLQAGHASHRLSLRFTVTAGWLDTEENELEPILITGDTWLPTTGLRPLPGFLPILITARGYPSQEHIYVDLTDDELVAIHEASGGNGVTINLKLQATLLVPHPGIKTVMDADFDVRIPRSRWTEVLDEAGREISITLRVPSPLTDPVEAAMNANKATTASLSQATTRLREARKQLRDHRWEQSVATCRKVLENIRAMTVLPTEASLKAKGAQHRDKRERWAMIFYDTYSMTSGAVHEGAKMTIDSIDAEAILGMTAALLRQYSRR